jgi:hypothetical protein
VLYDAEVLALAAIGVDLSQNFCVPEGVEQSDPHKMKFNHVDDNQKRKCQVQKVSDITVTQSN